MKDLVRIVVIDVSNVLGSQVFDEALFPVEETTESSKFLQQYMDMSKYRIITV